MLVVEVEEEEVVEVEEEEEVEETSCLVGWWTVWALSWPLLY